MTVQRQISNGLVVLNWRSQDKQEHSLAALPLDFYDVAAQVSECSSNSDQHDLLKALIEAGLEQKHGIALSLELATALWRDYRTHSGAKQEVLL
jgi:hypothetical protein